MTNADVRDFIDLLAGGDFDNSLDELREALNKRMDVIEAMAAATIRTGMIVTNTQPGGRKMPALQRGIVTGSTRGGKIKVDFGRYGNWTWPATMLREVKDDFQGIDI